MGSPAVVFSGSLVDLVPAGIVLCKERVIVDSNPQFAELFGYTRSDLIGVSLERLYPSYRDFADRRAMWEDPMRRIGHHCDERYMFGRAVDPIWVRVKGRCEDSSDPFRMTACIFELAVPRAAAMVDLSFRERQIVDAMCDGLTSKQIARKLDLSHRTIETYKARLMVKVGAKNANQLLASLR